MCASLPSLQTLPVVSNQRCHATAVTQRQTRYLTSRLPCCARRTWQQLTRIYDLLGLAVLCSLKTWTGGDAGAEGKVPPILGMIESDQSPCSFKFKQKGKVSMSKTENNSFPCMIPAPELINHFCKFTLY